MSLEQHIIDGLDDIGYPDINELESDNYLINLTVVQLSKLVCWITDELHGLLNLESKVHEIASDADTDSFQIELSSILKELCSPYNANSLNEITSKLAILHYLTGELLAARICIKKDGLDSLCAKSRQQPLKIEMQESDTAKHLRTSMAALGIPKPAADCIDSGRLFTDITTKINEKVKQGGLKLEKSLLYMNSEPLAIKEHHWQQLDRLQKKFSDEYTIRRKTLITRGDCTVESFKWKKANDKQKASYGAQVESLYQLLKDNLTLKSEINVPHVLAVRESECEKLLNSVVSKTHQNFNFAPSQIGNANQGLQQRISLHKYLIGNVPDRGGRPNEQPKPTTETFSQQQRNRQQGGRGGGGHNHHRDNRDNAGGFQRSNVSLQHQSQQYQHQQHQQNFKETRVQGAGWNQQQSYHNHQYDARQKIGGGGGGQHDNRRSSYSGYGNQYNNNNNSSNNYSNNGNYHHHGGRGGNNHYQGVAAGDQYNNNNNNGNNSGAYRGGYRDGQRTDYNGGGRGGRGARRF